MPGGKSWLRPPSNDKNQELQEKTASSDTSSCDDQVGKNDRLPSTCQTGQEDASSARQLAVKAWPIQSLMGEKQRLEDDVK